MKKNIFALCVLAFCLSSCSNDDDLGLNTSESETVAVTFNVSGDFTLSTSPITRALTADGKAMTDVWVLDYVDGVLKQQLHQTGEDADFGTPTLSLALGEHHIYFVASRGTGATVNTEAKAITFSKVSDTFWQDYSIAITGGTASGNRAVALDRVVTKLKVTFTDEIQAGAATFNVTPTAWHYGFSYQTGEPSAATDSQVITVNIPADIIGVTGESLSVFCFSSATEWQTDVALNCKTSDGTVLGSATLADVPFRRNRVSEFTGPLFGDNGSMMLSLNTDWSTSYNGTW